MILIPEIETVVILVPRTASGLVKRRISERYPRAIALYRHMEADGVPAGYDRWEKVGVVREPIARLWSLYKYLRDAALSEESAYVERMRGSVSLPFPDWIVDNREIFSDPYDSAGLGRYWPYYTVRHPIPENLKSQFVYLRPDLGTRIHRFDDLGSLASRLDVNLGDEREINLTADSVPPPLSERARDHVERFLRWDLAMTGTTTATDLA